MRQQVHNQILLYLFQEMTNSTLLGRHFQICSYIFRPVSIVAVFFLKPFFEYTKMFNSVIGL